MKTIKIMYLRHLIKARKWANTEKGERVIVTIGATLSIMVLIAFAMLAVGILNMLEYQIGTGRAIMLVVAFYVLIWGVCRTIKTKEE